MTITAALLLLSTHALTPAGPADTTTPPDTPTTATAPTDDNPCTITVNTATAPPTVHLTCHGTSYQITPADPAA